jgi:AcrR family transcriptional regulator
MSKSTLYKYFPSKEDVIVCLIDDACSETEADLNGLNLAGGTASQALEKLVAVQAGHADRVPRAVVLQHTRLPGACQDRIEVTNARLAAAFREVIVRGTTSNEFGFGNAVLAATAFMAAAQESMKAAARGEFDGSRGESIRVLLELFKPGLASRELAGV